MNENDITEGRKFHTTTNSRLVHDIYTARVNKLLSSLAAER